MSDESRGEPELAAQMREDCIALFGEGLDGFTHRYPHPPKILAKDLRLCKVREQLRVLSFCGNGRHAGARHIAGHRRVIAMHQSIDQREFGSSLRLVSQEPLHPAAIEPV